jgi:probable F420-dependent oxidoreductase
MALKDQLEFGYVLPCRSWAPIDMKDVREVAVRADALGFRDLWVTENNLDESFSLDSMVVLSYAAALTQRIRVGVSVVVLPVHNPVHVAHEAVSLDYVSGGRAILGVGLGRAEEYANFGVPPERRVSRFNEQVELIKTIWTQGAHARFQGEFYNIEHGMTIAPVQKPHPPIWLGGSHPDSLRRAARIADGWMGAGGSTKKGFIEAVPLIRQSLESAGRDPAEFAISKRVFMAVHEDESIARAEALRWFTEVYHNPGMLETSGFAGTPAQLSSYIEELHAAGATHLLLNPIYRYQEQLETIAEVVGLK